MRDLRAHGRKRAAVTLSIVQTTTGYWFSGDACLPKLQLHSPPVQKNGGGFIVNTWTERGRQRQALGKRMHQEGQHQSRLQYGGQRQADSSSI